jgi:hypothetical protein
VKNQNLKLVSIITKVVAILAWVFLPWLAGMYRHYNTFFFVQNSIQSLLAIIPNRCLVFSRLSFCVFLTLALLPLDWFLFYPPTFTGTDINDIPLIVVVVFVWLFLFTSLPLSLILSRIRFRRGEKFIYA